MSERDTYRGNTIENLGCLFIYIYVWTYVGRPSRIIVLARWSTLSQTSLNRILWLSIITRKIELVTTLNSIVGAVRTKKTCCSSISIRVSGCGKLFCHSYKSYATVFTWKFIVHYTDQEGKPCVGMFSCVKYCVLQLLFS